MLRRAPVSILLLCCVGVAVAGDEAPAEMAGAAADTVVVDGEPLVVHPFGHASFALEGRGRVVIVDPVGGGRRYASLPRPDLILITHRHGDHFDADTVRDLAGEYTWVIAPPDVAESIASNDPLALANGDSATIHGMGVKAVPAYNRTASRLDFHPRGRDNGYVLDLAGLKVYVSGDTEDVPEQAELGPVDVAFVCMNLPFTMSAEQAVKAVRAIHPRVLYPYHYRNRDGSMTDLQPLQRALEAEGVCEIRILDWY